MADFPVDQGSTFQLDVQPKDPDGAGINMSGCTFSGQVRVPVSSSSLLCSFTFLLIDNFTVRVTLEKEKTAALPCDTSTDADRVITQFDYDCHVQFPDGTSIRFLSGILNVSPEATR